MSPRIPISSHNMIALIHAARIVIISGIALLLWFDFFTWSPPPPYPGGPIVMAINSPLSAIIITLYTLLRSFIAGRIWFQRNDTTEFSIVLDVCEILVVSFAIINQAGYNGFTSHTILFSTLAILSISSLVLCLIFYMKKDSY